MNTLFLIIAIASFLIGIVFLILFIIGLFAKKLKIRPKISILAVIICVISFIYCSVGYTATMSPEQKAEQEKIEQQKADQQENKKSDVKANNESVNDGNEKEEKEEKEDKDSAIKKSSKQEDQKSRNTKNENQDNKKKYDALQRVFIAINKDTSIEELNTLISDNNLHFTTQEYNDDSWTTLIYKIAYTDGVALQKYADSGDNLEVAFSNNNNILEYAVYNKEQNGKEVIFYNFGTWYDFRETEPNNKYSGYYFIDNSTAEKMFDENGIKIKYSNGNVGKTNYYAYNSAEDVLDKLLG